MVFFDFLGRFPTSDPEAIRALAREVKANGRAPEPREEPDFAARSSLIVRLNAWQREQRAAEALRQAYAEGFEAGKREAAPSFGELKRDRWESWRRE